MRDLDLPRRHALMGVPVLVVAGFETRGRDTYAPKAGLSHHTAGPKTGEKPSLATVINGRSDLPGPLANTFQSRGANGADVADFAQAEALVRQAVETFGGLDVLVNNAGFLRDRMLVNATEDEWDAVIRVHLKGHFAPLRHAAAYWRAEAKAGRPRAGRVVNTSSGAGLQGSIGQSAYSAAKAGIAGLTLVAAAELARFGVTVNAIAPVARTRMTEGVFDASLPDPGDNSPIVVWLASEVSGHVTGRVFEIDGGRLTLEDGWRHGASRDAGRRWEVTELGEVVDALLAEGATPEPVYGTT